jgi:hypothetical protein
MFRIRKEKVEIVDQSGNKEVYEIGPLNGEYLEDLYAVMSAMGKVGGDDKNNDKFLEVLGSNGVSKKLHGLVYKSLEMSYPEQDKKVLEQFVTQNLYKFIEAIVKVNVPQN